MSGPWNGFSRQRSHDQPIHPPGTFWDGPISILDRPPSHARHSTCTCNWIRTEGDSHFALGLLDLELWQLDQAESHFNQAIELQQSIPSRTKGVSKAMARLSEVVEIRDGNQERAITLLKQSVQLHPDHYEAWYRLWKLLEATSATTDAEQARLGYFSARDRVRPRTEFPE